MTLAVLMFIGKWSLPEALIGTDLALFLVYGAGTFAASAINRKLGGLTVDVCGALNELLELLLLTVSSGLLSIFQNVS